VFEKFHTQFAANHFFCMTSPINVKTLALRFVILLDGLHTGRGVLMPSTLTQPAVRRTPKKAKDRRKPLNMRILPETRLLIDQAAELTGKTLTDFVLDAARQAAQNVLLDRSVIPVSDKAYAAFVALLDAAPQPNERLRKSLQTPAVWG
jgi:uncharacterized protein (DUF1778 family)